MKYCLRNGCVYAANLFASGTLLQTFLSAKGLTGAQIGAVAATLSMAQMITILLFSGCMQLGSGVTYWPYCRREKLDV